MVGSAMLRMVLSSTTTRRLVTSTARIAQRRGCPSPLVVHDACEALPGAGASVPDMEPLLKMNGDAEDTRSSRYPPGRHSGPRQQV